MRRYLFILVVTFLVTLAHGSLPRGLKSSEENATVQKSCFTNCTLNDGSMVLLCENVTRFDCPTDSAVNITKLSITGGLFQKMSLAFLPPFPRLTELSIRSSQLMAFDTLPGVETLESLEIFNNTRLKIFHWTKLTDAANLTRLHIVNNTLSYFDSSVLFHLKNHSLTTLDLSGNRWDCKKDYRYIFEIQDILLHRNELKCQREPSWMKWSYSIINLEKTKKDVREQCKQRTPSCSCYPLHGHNSYSVDVNCAYRGLSQLPATLPDNTTELNVMGNQLTSLDQIKLYHPQLKIVIADSNQIRSIGNLSGSYFIKHFRRLSLQNNSIQPHEIPLAEIAETTEFEHRYIYLYNNSWECDCKLATTFRDWLWQNRHIVNDSSLLLCSNQGKQTPVLHLLPPVVCGTSSAPIEGREESEDRAIRLFHIIIAMEIFFIALVLVNLAYDSWRYLYHGELPWAATKIF